MPSRLQPLKCDIAKTYLNDTSVCVFFASTYIELSIIQNQGLLVYKKKKNHGGNVEKYNFNNYFTT